ncbi:MAG: hypothetical protein ABSE93_02005 [Terriglobia bacterium]|jgi:hypothetical protein
MRSSLAVLGWLTVTGIMAVTIVSAQDRDSRQPIAWCYVQEGPLELMQRALGRRTKPLSVGHGTLAPVLKTESKNGRERALVRVTDLSTLEPVDGWVDSSKAEIVPIDRFPSDEELLRQLGSEYRDDFTLSKIALARWLVKQGNSGTALVCLVASVALPASRLVAFLPRGGNFTRGPWLEFPFSEMKPGILSAEVRDLLGDEIECLITHEPFRKGPEVFGVNIVIRRLERGNFRTLWSAPLESRNLDFFPSELQILHPLEKNAGAPGTVTKAEVEFQPRGNIYIPVWKATVEFRAVGQDKPLNSVKVTKACAWNGSEFEPLQ